LVFELTTYEPYFLRNQVECFFSEVKKVGFAKNFNITAFIRLSLYCGSLEIEFLEIECLEEYFVQRGELEKWQKYF